MYRIGGGTRPPGVHFGNRRAYTEAGGRTILRGQHMKINRGLFSVIALALLVVGLIAAPAAKADSIQFTLDIANTGLQASGPGPYAKVTFTLNASGGIDVVLQGLDNGVGGNYSFFG